GSIAGVVKDTSGNPLPGVTVEAQDDRNGRTQAVTDQRGAFTNPTGSVGKKTLTFGLPRVDIADMNEVSVSNGTTAVTATATIDQGCAAYRRTSACLTYRQVAADVPAPFRPLWEHAIGGLAAVQAALPCDRISLRRTGALLFFPGSSYSLTLY